MGKLMEGHTYSNGKSVWQIEDLWNAVEGMPVHHMPVELFVEQLQGTCWTQGDETVTPNWVLSHTRRILGADLEYPMIIDSEGIILDGIHRLCKAVIEGRETVAVQRIVLMPDPSLAVIEDDFPLFI